MNEKRVHVRFLPVSRGGFLLLALCFGTAALTRGEAARTPQSLALSIENCELRPGDNGAPKMVVELREPLPDELKKADLRFLFVKEGAAIAPKTAVDLPAQGTLGFSAAYPWSRSGGVLSRNGKELGFLLDLTALAGWSGPSPNEIVVPLDAKTLLPGMATRLAAGTGELLVAFVEYGPDGETKVLLSNTVRIALQAGKPAAAASPGPVAPPAPGGATWPFKSPLPDGFRLANHRRWEGRELWVIQREAPKAKPDDGEDRQVVETVLVVRGTNIPGDDDDAKKVAVALWAAEVAAGRELGSTSAQGAAAGKVAGATDANQYGFMVIGRYSSSAFFPKPPTLRFDGGKEVAGSGGLAAKQADAWVIVAGATVARLQESMANAEVAGDLCASLRKELGDEGE